MLTSHISDRNGFQFGIIDESAVYCEIGFSVRDVYTKTNVPHPMIDIYGAFGSLIIIFEWLIQ